MVLYNVENRENSILLKFLDNANKKKTKNTTEGIEYDLEKNYIFISGFFTAALHFSKFCLS